MWYYDYRLAWNPKDFGNITMIYLPNSALWTPDIYMRQDIEDNDNMVGTMKDGNIQVYSTGECYYSRIGTFTIFTEFDLTKYP